MMHVGCLNLKLTLEIYSNSLVKTHFIIQEWLIPICGPPDGGDVVASSDQCACRCALAGFFVAAFIPLSTLH